MVIAETDKTLTGEIIQAQAQRFENGINEVDEKHENCWEQKNPRTQEVAQAFPTDHRTVCPFAVSKNAFQHKMTAYEIKKAGAHSEKHRENRVKQLSVHNTLGMERGGGGGYSTAPKRMGTRLNWIYLIASQLFWMLSATFCAEAPLT